MMLLILLSLLGVGSCTRPRGVRAELATLYNPESDFSCLDGSGSIPFIQVNDDYCDCDDGSDEPGTSACPNANFYCENKGHNVLVIPSSRVNDGICDCCDGSDEWEAGSVCQNTCSELGRAAREAAQAAAKTAMAGFNIKQGMINESTRLRDEKLSQLADKEKVLFDLEARKEEKRLAKEAAEAPEKEALDFYKQLEEQENKKKEEEEAAALGAEAEQYFSSLDVNQDGAVSLEELQARPGLDTNKDGSVSEEEAKFFLSGHESFDLETFKSIGFTLLKPYLDLEQTTPEDPAPVEQQEELELESTASPPVSQDPEVYDPWRANQMKAEDSADIDHEPEDYEDGEEEKEEEEDEGEEDYDIAEPPPVAPQQDGQIEDKYDERTRALIEAAEEARKQFDEVDREMGDIDREIKKIQKEMETDYGVDNEFLVISDQCFEYSDLEYTYKMCPFDNCAQTSKNGGSETRLGSWQSWHGPEGNKHSQMKFGGGQQCWNGPTRSAIVHLHCGTDNVLTAVSEPNRCEYEMHFTTPAACTRPDLGHDEL